MKLKDNIRTVALQGNKIKIIDAKSGKTVRSIQFNGQLVQGPISTGESFQIVCRYSPTNRVAKIYSLNTGKLERQFKI
tara:strand:+ start:562 stop:795 length:234 start_codon:yes stop_codon:yes gene_type:complete